MAPVSGPGGAGGPRHPAIASARRLASRLIGWPCGSCACRAAGPSEAADRADRSAHRRPDRRPRHLCRPLRVFRRGRIRRPVPIFEVQAPSEEWARQLHGFGWLRHLRATDMAPVALQCPRPGRRMDPPRQSPDAIAWEPEVVARRIISWLAQTPLVLEGCDLAFYRRFMRSITRQIRYLRRTAAIPARPAAAARHDRARLCVAVDVGPDRRPQAGEPLARPRARPPDPARRRPHQPQSGAILEVLIDLLPLRQAFAARGGRRRRCRRSTG